jgi:hypothetical protein
VEYPEFRNPKMKALVELGERITKVAEYFEKQDRAARTARSRRRPPGSPSRRDDHPLLVAGEVTVAEAGVTR